jgi:PEP-CTERM motif-containing protein
MRMQKAAVVLFLMAVLPGAAEAAGVSPGDHIDIAISNPVLTGFDTNDPNVGQRGFFDNTQTAVVNIFTFGSTTQIFWGDAANGPVPDTTPGSLLSFSSFGPGIGVVGPDFGKTPFPITSLVFFNGTSTGASLIFGFTISFSDHESGVSLGSDQVIITTTNNQNVSQSQDADYINICGAGSNICSTSISAYESKSAGPIFNLSGVIVGDPVLTLTGVTLTGNTENGELGNQLPLGVDAVPEPSTWAMMLLGFAGIGFMAYRNRKNGLVLAA